MSTQQDKQLTQPQTTPRRFRGPGRSRLRKRPDRRLAVRLRYHCDQDLISALKKVPNMNKVIRRALRRYFQQEEQESVAEVIPQ